VHWLSHPVYEAAAKRELLARRVQQAAGIRVRSLSPEGRRAVSVLLAEVELQRSHRGHLPRVWGRLAPPGSALDPGAP
jgi:hypothetical protein